MLCCSAEFRSHLIPLAILSCIDSTVTRRLPESVDLVVLGSSGILRKDVSLNELPGYLADKAALVWCDIYNTESGQQGPYGRLLAETFGFDELTVEDCFTRIHLPKVDIYEDYLFLALFSFHLSEKRRRAETVEVDMYVGENYVVCTSPALERARQGEAALLSGNEFVSSSPANVAHTVLDAVADEYLPVMSRLSAMVDGIEDELLSED